MVEYLFISSVMNGIWRSLCNVKFETYHGALVMVRSTFDLSLWIILVFDGLAHPHSWIPCVQIGFNMYLYIKVLFSRESNIILLSTSGFFKRSLSFQFPRWRKALCCEQTKLSAPFHSQPKIVCNFTKSVWNSTLQLLKCWQTEQS
jgi:hypothetical protein